MAIRPLAAPTMVPTLGAIYLALQVLRVLRVPLLRLPLNPQASCHRTRTRPSGHTLRHHRGCYEKRPTGPGWARRAPTNSTTSPVAVQRSSSGSYTAIGSRDPPARTIDAGDQLLLFKSPGVKGERSRSFIFSDCTRNNYFRAATARLPFAPKSAILGPESESAVVAWRFQISGER